MKTKKFSITLSERHLQIIDKIKEEDGAITISGALHVALAFYIKKLEPPRYAHLGAIKIGKTPEERAKESVDLKMAKDNRAKEIKYNAKKNICENVLGGEVFKDASGGFSCRFYTYFEDVEDEEQILPLDNVNEGYAKHQFFPNKEAVLKKKPELANKFKK